MNDDLNYPIQQNLTEYENTHGEINNFIGIFPNLYDKDYCASIIKYFDTACEEGFGYKHHWGCIRKDSVMFSDTAIDLKHLGHFYKNFLDTFWNIAYKEYKEKYEVLDNSGVHAIFSCKVQKSKIGEGFHKWHFDGSTRETAGRVLVFILYLNDVEEGGETEFLYIPKRVKPTTGTLLVFPAAVTHTHRGNTPISNSKYILTGWVEY